LNKMGLEGIGETRLKTDEELSRSLTFALISLIMLPPNDREEIKKRIQDLIQAISERNQSAEE